MSRDIKALPYAALFALAVVVCDQIVKGLVRHSLELYESRTVIPGVLDITYHMNTGVAFSLFRNSPLPLLVGVNIAVLALFGWMIYPHAHTRMGMLAAGLVAGGAVGNLFDRILLKGVVDYIKFPIWPVFNLADVCVVCGVGLLFILLLRAASRRQEGEASS